MLLVLIATVVLQGCVAIPPLIQVQHKDSNDELRTRLDSIDRRLDRLEQRAEASSDGK
jgi:starvation-inducible outer membrane lipoprotein